MKTEPSGEIDVADLAPKQSPLKEKILKLLSKNIRKRQRVSLVDIANAAECSPRQAQQQLEALTGEGYNIEVDPEQKLELSTTIPKQDNVRIKTADYFGDDWVRFGAVADTHLVSKYARLDVLNALYDVFEREGIRTVYHGGNWIDGECKFNKYDLHCIGFENQLAYFLKHYPQRKGVETHIISGDDHEGWYVQRDQINVGRVMQSRAAEVGRSDLHDLGYMERDLVFERGGGSSTIRVIHAGGGTAYALSYTSQKYAEMLQGGEKPAIVLIGHYHKFDWSYPREVHTVQCGTTQDQTPFMRKKRIQAMVGGCIVEAKQDRRGVFNRVRVEWIPFYDKRYYQYHWK